MTCCRRSVSFELRLLRADLEHAIQGHTGRGRVDALLRFLADFYGSYQMRALVEIEPGLVLGQMARALPALVELIAPELQGQVSDPQVVATALVRLSVCHYLVPGLRRRPVDRPASRRRRCTVTAHGACGTS